MILADIASGNVDFADVVFLIAVIVAVVGLAWSVMERGVTSALMFAILGLVALGWLVL